MRTHCQTSGWSLTAQDVFNNVTRTAIEAMAATQGHTQSLHTNALDEAIALPTDFSARIARNTQLFLQQESGTTRVADPWGGSHYVERLTYELASEGVGAHRGGRAARRHGQGDRRGHPEDAHRGGRRPHPGAHRLTAARPSSASTSSALESEAPIEMLKVDNARVRESQIAKLARLKGERDEAAVKAALAAITDGARGNGNLLDLAVKAARAKATVGEISDAMEAVYGRHRAEIRSVSGVYRSEAGAMTRTSHACR